MQGKEQSRLKFAELVALYEKGNFQLLLSKALPIFGRSATPWILLSSPTMAKAVWPISNR